MRKPIGAEIRDQALHALVGMGITLVYCLLFIFLTKVPPLYYMPGAVGMSWLVGLFREWIQHGRVYWPDFTGGAMRDIMFFAVGSILMCGIIIGVLTWIQ